MLCVDHGGFVSRSCHGAVDGFVFAVFENYGAGERAPGKFHTLKGYGGVRARILPSVSKPNDVVDKQANEQAERTVSSFLVEDIPHKTTL